MTLTKQQHQEIYLELDKEAQKLRRQWVKADNAAIAVGYAGGTVQSALICSKADMFLAAYKAAREVATAYFNTYVK